MFGLTPYRRGNGYLTSNGFWDVDKFFDDFFNEPSMNAPALSPGHMRVDIKETENAYLVYADLPGVKKEELSVEVDNDVLFISVEKKEEIDEEKEQYVRKERRSMNLKRSFRLEGVDAEGIQAKLEEGVLTLELPKKEPEQPKKKSIDIQ
ncbi:Hsp20/alpha crystallin family protein [Anaerotalea alkaliphila]|uniref:Hsp20/alpha crystallin family protein n=1 Tax=Anaerotalea alkaliphila TaxID=2662126 RepID=A0A7X5HVH7_9FIRM|nr:Hsp20/alpha crystallin family protein [Anaerotalea alkaliphila]NDL67418.1 Hsp20/alpha crystallin family protein [Anaerotalea alkaliphila]